MDARQKNPSRYKIIIWSILKGGSSRTKSLGKSTVLNVSVPKYFKKHIFPFKYFLRRNMTKKSILLFSRRRREAEKTLEMNQRRELSRDPAVLRTATEPKMQIELHRGKKVSIVIKETSSYINSSVYILYIHTCTYIG